MAADKARTGCMDRCATLGIRMTLKLAKAPVDLGKKCRKGCLFLHGCLGYRCFPDNVRLCRIVPAQPGEAVAGVARRQQAPVRQKKPATARGAAAGPFPGPG